MREAVKRFNPNTVEVLYQKFSDLSDVGRRKRLAFDFLMGGVPDDQYFDLLQSSATTAVNDPAPTVFAYDAQGEAIRGAVNVDFQNWCFNANLKLSDCSKTRISDYYLDLIDLAIVGDPRSNEIFWKGLKFSNIGVAFLGASGLRILGKSNAIEKIEARASILSAGAARALAISFLEFNDLRGICRFREILSRSQNA